MWDELIELLGEDAAARLVARLGGCKLQVPVWREDGRGLWLSRIVEAVGEQAARAFCAHYQGEIVEIPNGKRAGAGEVRAAVLDCAARGMDINSTALSCGVTNRRVRQILERARKSERQIDMFGTNVVRS